MTEADLCQQLIAAASSEAWAAYPEQGGWDILLVRAGVQVGVQAKLVGNIHMLLQASDDNPRDLGRAGPHYRAVLVGRWPGRTPRARQEHKSELIALAMRLRLLVLQPPDPDWRYAGGDSWLSCGHPHSNMYRFHRFNCIDWRWYRWPTRKPVWVPPFVPDLPAGVPNPRSVSAYQIACIRLEQLALSKGWICRDDVKAVQEEIGGSWNLGTPMTQFFSNTGQRAHGRQMKWLLRRSPSKLWPDVAKGMK